MSVPSKKEALFKLLQRIPGGILLLPMLLGALAHLLPDTEQLFGEPASTLFSQKATMCLVGLLLFFSGAQSRPGEIWSGLKHDGPLFLLKLLINGSVIILSTRFCASSLWGISLPAVAACIASCNPGLFLGLTSQYGSHSDRACFAFLNILSLPGIAVCLFHLTSGFSIAPVLGGILPFALGVLFGILLPSLRKSNVIKLLLPFLGLSLGFSIDVTALGRQLLPGLILSLLYLLTNTFPLMLTERKILHRSGLTSAAACSVAGVSLSVPALITSSAPQWAASVSDASAQLTVALVLTNIASAFFAKAAAKTQK